MCDIGRWAKMGIRDFMEPVANPPGQLTTRQICIECMECDGLRSPSAVPSGSFDPTLPNDDFDDGVKTLVGQTNHVDDGTTQIITTSPPSRTYITDFYIIFGHIIINSSKLIKRFIRSSHFPYIGNFFINCSIQFFKALVYL